MPFSFYRRLSTANQAIYRQSDALAAPTLPDPAALAPMVENLRDTLAADDRRRTLAGAHTLVAEILGQLAVRPVKVRVLSVRPSNSGGELHGLYQLAADSPAVIKVWMRTAVRADVVSFRTFLRTLIHEISHHLDYALFRLGDSYHTEGFFKRESGLMRQLTAAITRGRRAPAAKTKRKRATVADKAPTAVRSALARRARPAAGRSESTPTGEAGENEPTTSERGATDPAPDTRPDRPGEQLQLPFT